MKYTCGFVLMIMILLGTAACTVPANNKPAASEQVAGAMTTETTAPADNELAGASAQAGAPSPSPSVSSSPASASAEPSPASSPKKKDLAATAAEKKACDVLDVRGYTQEEILKCFTSVEISDGIFARMQGRTFKKNCTTKRADLRYIRVLHCGFDGKTHIGELVVNKKILKDILYIFKKLYLNDYPIEKMKLADDYNADDDASMADNNTSSFNFRVVEGTQKLSNHAYGLAVDINPLYNPYVLIKNGKKKIEPPDAKKYADRKLDCPYYIKKGDLLWKLFHERGFTWGGSWRSPDYQHFSKNP